MNLNSSFHLSHVLYLFFVRFSLLHLLFNYESIFISREYLEGEQNSSITIMYGKFLAFMSANAAIDVQNISFDLRTIETMTDLHILSEAFCIHECEPSD